MQTQMQEEQYPLQLHALARNWWLILIRGICAVIFGILAFAWPGITLLTLVLLYGAYAMADGIFAIIAAFKGGTMGSRWWLGVVGLLGVAAGIIAFSAPGLTAIVLLLIIACWSIAMGIAEIYGAIKLRKEIEGEWLLILSGILSVLFGIALLARPGIGALALVWLIGSFAIVYGILTIGFSLRLRSHSHPAPAPRTT